MEDPSGWNLIESDPSVFEQLLVDVGVEGLQVDELYSLDEETFDQLKPVKAFIFLFRWVGKEQDGYKAGIEVDPQDCGIFFANQVVNNACGTMAALNAVMNIPEVDSEYQGESIKIGPELQRMKEFSMGMDSVNLGHLISSNPLIREIHNSFSRSTPFTFDPSSNPDADPSDAYHFVTYAPFNGLVYELDGLREKPLMHAAALDDWTIPARQIVQHRINTYPEGQIHFSLLAISDSRKPLLKRHLKDPTLSTSEKEDLSWRLKSEEHKTIQATQDNALRRNNLIPAVLGLLKALGESGVVDTLRESSRKDRKVKKMRSGDE
ncbi:hypothetical protein M231_05156 [Tremella mesenterica]|uniref:Ubiquitin carboxyl-terminal hydrolase n=1 Tax=Tremella mesenterica TaxID=5217 RepID=A0A4Q1BIW4_TREME|nr:hypothetical protein M231_05156 [Tremella mesenterica]